MSAKFSRLFLVTISFAVASCAVPPLWSQSTSPSDNCPCPPSQPAPHPSEPDFTNAANKWQLAAAKLESQIDTVNPTLREQRDAFWKVPLGTYRDEKKAAEAAGGGFFLSHGSWTYSPSDPEFSAVKGATWVIATFENFHVYAIGQDYELLYTEMNFRLEQIFKQPDGLSLSNGALVDAAIPGGRIESPNGKIFTSRIEPQQHGLQPGHKYLLQLLYEPQGVFFLANACWDLSSGKVESDSPVEAYRIAHGRFSIVGMSLSDLINYLPKALPDDPDE
jgi:hypothetical protein